MLYKLNKRIIDKLEIFKCELINELQNNILSYWICNAPDYEKGGFIGMIDGNDKRMENATKGGILNARILWTFSSAYKLTKEKKYLDIADRAYQYITEYFIDETYGGSYWELDSNGIPVNKRKQIYALSFTIYGFTEYYKITKNKDALNHAVKIFGLIEKYSFDKERNGYYEAFSEKWDPLEDVRLSEKDKNEKKTMNTHLHILEAYTNLFRVWKNNKIKKALYNLIRVHIDYIVDKNTGHLKLFFDEDWNLKSDEISFGHDIECSWLIDEAAIVLGNKKLIKEVKNLAVKIVHAADEGLDKDGGLMSEKDPANDHMDDDKHWWPQAEAMVGYFNAYQNTGNEAFLQKCFHVWEFTKDYIIDHINGEWLWKVNRQGEPYRSEEKAGFWKCPYHNGRACIELIQRIGKILK
jgi:mannobiose 2-epimerase